MPEYVVALWLATINPPCGDPCHSVPPHGQSWWIDGMNAKACVATDSPDGGMAFMVIKRGHMVVLMGPGVHPCEEPTS